MHPFKELIIWKSSWRSWLPVALAAAFLIFMIVAMFLPGGPQH